VRKNKVVVDFKIRCIGLMLFSNWTKHKRINFYFYWARRKYYLYLLWPWPPV